MNTLFQDTVHAKRVEAGGVCEQARTIPVAAEVDVVVCGGGPAGVGAALAAAREGARTLLLERFGMLGGLWTVGLMNPFFECFNKGYVVQDLIDRLKAEGAWRTWLFAATFDNETMRRVLEAMMGEAGADFLYDTLAVDAIVEDGRVRGVVIESKAGRQAVLAKVVIDATGDGDMAARAGCRYECGREQDGLVQPMTLMFEIRGAGRFEQTSAGPLYDAMQAAIRAHNLNIEIPVARTNAAPWIIALPCHDMAAVETTHVYGLNPLSPADLTRGTVEARKQVWDMVKVLKHVPGFEKIELIRSAGTLGVRESRRIFGRYRLEYADLRDGRRFDDAVTPCSFCVDIHEPVMGTGDGVGHGTPMQPYEIPYRCLVAADVEGLLLAGRCLSGSHVAHASYRVTGTAMATGQAAGLAAALAVRAGVTPADVDGPKLKQALAGRGVQFL